MKTEQYDYVVVDARGRKVLETRTVDDVALHLNLAPQTVRSMFAKAKADEFTHGRGATRRTVQRIDKKLRPKPTLEETGTDFVYLAEYPDEEEYAETEWAPAHLLSVEELRQYGQWNRIKEVGKLSLKQLQAKFEAVGHVYVVVPVVASSQHRRCKLTRYTRQFYQRWQAAHTDEDLARTTTGRQVYEERIEQLRKVKPILFR